MTNPATPDDGGEKMIRADDLLRVIDRERRPRSLRRHEVWNLALDRIVAWVNAQPVSPRPPMPGPVNIPRVPGGHHVG